jgi:hypothetical protein
MWRGTRANAFVRLKAFGGVLGMRASRLVG